MKYPKKLGSVVIGSSLLIGCAIKPEIKDTSDVQVSIPRYLEHNVCYPEEFSCESRKYFDLDGDRETVEEYALDNTYSNDIVGISSRRLLLFRTSIAFCHRNPHTEVRKMTRNESKLIDGEFQELLDKQNRTKDNESIRIKIIDSSYEHW